MKLDRYMTIGLGLMVFGAPFGLYSYYVLLDTTFAALGLACMVLGSIFLLTPSSPVPSESVRLMVEAANVNVEAMLEMYDIKDKALYTPRDGRVFCVFETDLFVFPAGGAVVRLSGIDSEMGFEDALSLVLVDTLELVGGVRAVERGGDIVVELTGVVLGTDYPRVNHCMGSLPVSVAGCVAVYLRGMPVRYLGEESVNGVVTGRFRMDG